MSEVIIERRLSPGENFFRCRTEVGFYNNFASVAAYSRDLTADLALIYRALRKTVLDYHILACNIFKHSEDGYCLIRPIESATFGDLFLFGSESFSPDAKPVSEQCLHDLCHTTFFEINEETPLFKVILYGTHDLGATFEHTLSDGVVALSFHEIFVENLAFCDDSSNKLTYLNNYGPVPETISLSSVIFNYKDDKKYIKHSLPPPLEMVMQDLDVDYADNDPHHYSKLTPEGFPEKWPGRFPASKESHIAFKLFNIPPSEFSTILKKCKENGVTFTSYLNVIQALALQPIYGDKHHSSSVVAITLRRFLSPEKVTDPYKAILTKPGYSILGMYAHMGVPEFIPPLTEFSWDFVRKVHANLTQSVKNDKLLSMRRKWYDEASATGDNEEFFEGEIGKNKADSVKISNLGLGKFPVYESDSEHTTPGNSHTWTINDIVFAQDLAPNASEFVFSLVSSKSGGLNVVMSYFDHSFEDSHHQNFDEYPGKVRALLLEHAGVEGDQY